MWKREDIIDGVARGLGAAAVIVVGAVVAGVGLRYGLDPRESREQRAIAWGVIAVIGVGLSGMTCESIRLIREKVRRWRRAMDGRCVRCGYDLRATRERCPECGTVIGGA